MSEASRARIPRDRAPERVNAHERGVARVQLRALRAALPAAERRAADHAIGAALDRLLAELAPAVLAAYWPMGDEPDLRPRFEHWHAAGVRLVLPRVARRDAPLEFVGWYPGVALEDGPHRTRHPSGTPVEVPDTLVLPCLGFDARGYRLGYGGGYYDRTLERLPGARVVGVAYDACEIDGFVAQSHDRPLDWVITERRSLRR